MNPLAVTLFGPSHLAVLGVTLALPLLLALPVRDGNNLPLARRIAWTLATLVAGTKIVALLRTLLADPAAWPFCLPMHLCDWSALLAVLALVRGGRLSSELTWFWGLSATFQALLTPDLEHDFPAPEFFLFFLSHSGIVICALFLVLGLGRRPGKGAVWRAWATSQVYLACALAVNAACHTNYGYLCAKPAHTSLLDWLGPWPWYIASLEALALLYFAVLHAPWLLAERFRTRTKLKGGHRVPPLKRLISGGQTGADRAALDWALAHGVPHGGWCPRGRMAEDGPLPAHYALWETPSPLPAQRTRWNVRDSDATVIFSLTPHLAGGSLLTLRCAQRLGRPCLLLVPASDAATRLHAFLRTHRVRLLNVAGPRASEEPGIGAFVTAILDTLVADAPIGAHPPQTACGAPGAPR